MKLICPHQHSLLAPIFLGLLTVFSVNGSTPALVVRGLWLDAADDKIEEVALQDGYAYLANGLSGLRIVNVTNPAAPTLVGSIPLSGLVRGVAVSGDYVYLADWQNRNFHVVNISNPAAPRLESSSSSEGPLIDVEVAGHYAYVAGYSRGVEVFDISDPKHPNLVSTFPMHRCNALVHRDGYIFAAGIASGLSIIDVKDPAKSALAGEYQNGSQEIYEVTVSGRYAYLLGRESYGLDLAMSLEVVDISNVRQPVLVGYLSLSKGAYYLTVMDHFVLVGNINSAMELIDITDPAKPARVSTHYGPSAKKFRSSRPLATGGFIYWPNGDYGMEILTIEEAPALSISKPKIPGSVQVGWERMPGARLQKTRDLASPQWEDVPEPVGAAADPVVPTEGNAFFRVIKRLP